MEEQEGYPMPSPFGFGHSSDTSLQYQLEVHQIIEELEHHLKGEALIIKDGRASFHQVTDAMLNEKGINAVLSILRLRLSKIYVLSDLDEYKIGKITIKLGLNIIETFHDKWDEFMIDSDTTASQLLDLICDAVYATLNKARDGKYLKFLSTTTQVQEMQHRTIQQKPQMEQQQNVNPLNILFGKRR